LQLTVLLCYIIVTAASFSDLMLLLLHILSF